MDAGTDRIDYGAALSEAAAFLARPATPGAATRSEHERPLAAAAVLYPIPALDPRRRGS